MKVIITPIYLLFVFISILGIVACLYLNLPIWVIVFLGVSLAIFLLHEWMHIYAAHIVGITVNTVIFDIGNNATFIEPGDGKDPEHIKKEAKIFLAGVVFDLIFWGVLVTFLIADSLIYPAIDGTYNLINAIEFFLGMFLLLVVYWGNGIEWSDYQQYRKRVGD